MSRPIVVTGLGALSPVGLSAPTTAAALRAGVARLKELETFQVDSEHFAKKAVVGGRVPTEWFDGGPKESTWPGHERFGVEPPPEPELLVADDSTRLVELAVPAAREAFAASGLDRNRPSRVGLYLGLGEGEPSPPVVDALRRGLDARLTPVLPFPEGRAAGLLAAEAALRDLAEGKVDAALVGGVSSEIRGPVLERLDAAGTLRTALRPEGIIPGEAAAFAVLETAAGAARRDARPLARISAAVVGTEPTAGTKETNRAEGLTRVFHELVRAAPDLGPPALVVSDLNGDRYRAMEWSFALMRALTVLESDIDLRHPADCVGDVGAASGILNLVWAVTAFAKGYAPGTQAIVWGASDGAARAALALAAPEKKGG